MGEQDMLNVTLRNPGRSLAIGVRLKVKRLGRVDNGWSWVHFAEDEVLPSLWEDNYLSLLPGESRTVIARYEPFTRTRPLRLEIDGWNVEAATEPVQAVADGRRKRPAPSAVRNQP